MVIVLASGRVDAAVGGAAVVLHLEGEAGVGGAVGVGGGGEDQVAAASLTSTHVAGVDRDAVERQGAGRRQRGDDHAQEARWRDVERIGEAEVGGREGVAVSSLVVTVLSVPAGASLTEVTLMVIVLALWSRIDAAVGGAAVVLHLEGEAGVGGAVGVGGRGEDQVAAASLTSDHVAGVDGDAVEGQGAGRRQGGDDHAQEAVGGIVDRIGEAEVGGREGVAVSSLMVTVLSVPAGASLTEVTLMVIVLALWSVIDAAVGGAAVVLHLEGEAGVGGAVGVGGRGEDQVAQRR